MLTVDEVLISKHDLNHAVHVHVSAVHRVKLAVTARLLYYVVHLAARLEYFNALVLLLFEHLHVTLQIDVALWFDAPYPELLIVMLILLLLLDTSFLVKVAL